jgi:DNA/RNA endonuclease G (NUC1)
MKKSINKILLLLFLGILVSLTSVKAQDLVVLKHTNYTTTYSKSLKYPVVVEWWDTKAKVGCANPMARKDQFAPDPLDVADTKIQADYDAANQEHKAKGLKGFDRGHMCPAADNLCQTPQVQTECFYFSNMAPQYHALNAGDWKSLETAERQWSITNDSVHVWCGNIGKAEVLGPDKMAIPTKCWKVVYIVKTKEWFAYLFDNVDGKQTGLDSHKVVVADITKLTGLKFAK